MELRLISLLGLLTMCLVAWGLSENHRKVHWRILISGLALQFAFALLILRTGFGRAFFEWVQLGFDALTKASGDGAQFVFGNLSKFFIIQNVIAPGPTGMAPVEGGWAISAVIAFSVLPVIIFVSGLAGVLNHLRITDFFVRGMSWLMRRTLKTSGAETFGAVLEVFMGIESTSTYAQYLKKMTRSEIFTVMTTFLGTIAASVMVAYAGFGAEPGHLLAASLMSAPAAILISKLMIPEMETPLTSGAERISMPVETHNIFDAASAGAAQGLSMALNVGAMLIVFVGLVSLADMLLSTVTTMHLTTLLGWFFRPFAFLLGVTWQDIPKVSELLATKTVINEFIAYQHLQPLIQNHELSERSVVIATYALCGFANPGSLGILIGAISSLAPERRSEVAQLCVRALIAGTLTAFTTACVAGILT